MQMTRMGIYVLYRKPHTSTRRTAHPIYPYLLRHLTITRSLHVWKYDNSSAWSSFHTRVTDQHEHARAKEGDRG
jgi:hypothetical protein